jgi:hypothetical protein
MTVRFKRKLYARGGSFETTVPIQLLFSLDISKKFDVIFEYDDKSKKWVISFEERRKSKRP